MEPQVAAVCLRLKAVLLALGRFPQIEGGPFRIQLSLQYFIMFSFSRGVYFSKRKR